MSGLLDQILKKRNQLVSKHYSNAYLSTTANTGYFSSWNKSRLTDSSNRWNTVIASHLEEDKDDELPSAPLNALPLWETLEVLKRNSIISRQVKDNLDYGIWFVGTSSRSFEKDGNGRCIIDKNFITIDVPLSALPGHGEIDHMYVVTKIPNVISITATRFSSTFRESDRRMLVYFPSDQVDGIIYHLDDWRVTNISFAFCPKVKLDSYINYLVKMIRKDTILSFDTISVLNDIAEGSDYWATRSYDLTSKHPVTFIPVPNMSGEDETTGTMTSAMPTLDQLDEIVKRYVSGYCKLDNCLRQLADNPVATKLKQDYRKLQDMLSIDAENKEALQSLMTETVLNLGFQEEIASASSTLRTLAEQGFKQEEPDENKD